MTSCTDVDHLCLEGMTAIANGINSADTESVHTIDTVHVDSTETMPIDAAFGNYMTTGESMITISDYYSNLSNHHEMMLASLPVAFVGVFDMGISATERVVGNVHTGPLASFG